MIKRIYQCILTLTILISQGITFFDVIDGSNIFKVSFVVFVTSFVAILLFLFHKFIYKTN